MDFNLTQIFWLIGQTSNLYEALETGEGKAGSRVDDPLTCTIPSPASQPRAYSAEDRVRQGSNAKKLQVSLSHYRGKP